MVEILVATAIAGMLVSALAPAVFQVISRTTEGNASLTAMQDIQNAVRWVSYDGQMAESSDLVDGAPPVSSMTLTWTEWQGYETVDHSSHYFLVGDDLRRDYDGNVITVARYVSDIQFSLDGRVLTVTMTSAPEGDSHHSEQRMWRVSLRPMESAYLLH